MPRPLPIAVPASAADAAPVPSAANPATNLADALVGQRLRVETVVGDDALAQRLRALGLWAGTEIELLVKAPFGDPLLFKLLGFRLALRRDEAVRVLTSLAEAAR